MTLNHIKLSDTIEQDNAPISEIGAIDFSLESFISYLDERIAATRNKTKLEKYKKNILSFFPNGDYSIPLGDVQEYEELYQLIYELLTVPLIDESQYCWGLGFPFSSQLMYSTDALNRLLNGLTKKHFVGTANFKPDCTLSEPEVKKVIVYSFLIKRLYNIEIFNSSALVFRIDEQDSERYYEVDFNDKFIQISFDGVLPQIDNTIAEMENLSKESTLLWLEKVIPLKKIKFTGFSIVEITDITEKVMKERMRDLLLTSNLGLDFQNKISHIVRKLEGCATLDILMLPTLYLNNQIVKDVWQNISLKIQEILEKYEVSSTEFYNTINRYASNPRLVFRENIQKNREHNADLDILASSGILEGLIIKPIFSKNHLVGIIFIASQQRNVISDQLLVYMDEVYPIMQNLFETAVGNYMNELGKVIKTKFTSIQPSVEWKFNDVAVQYLNDKVNEKHPALLPIKFRDIYPIYGAIDFKNSTIERNQAEIEDRILQLEYLVSTIKKIQEISPIDLLEEWKHQATQWIATLEHGMDSAHEFALNQFLEKESISTFKQLEETDSRISKIIEPYQAGTLPGGIFHKNSIELEKTFKILNANIASILDQMNDKLQDVYPCYFERYRTDGIEFNIYIGQSITPNKPFNKLYLRNVQLWQLNTMALIAKVADKSQNDLPRKIYTTQLIFVHSNTITVSFRMDERRFDVEGTYNIRYEIIKKRIDKALIKGTGERLTQPGKIAIVYFQRKDIEDYLVHINYLQQMNILTPNIEEIELEDMQGVSGLKALRVSVSDVAVLDFHSPSLLLDSSLPSDNTNSFSEQK